ncbi:MAG: FAD:protein FMN transferase [Gammaproteobacteria bacterium]
MSLSSPPKVYVALLLSYYKKFIFTVFALSCVLLITGCEPEKPGPQITGSTMGTSYSVQWSDTSISLSTPELKDLIELRLGRINSLMSTYIPNSQLSGFNQSRETGWHAVDSELAKLIKLALSISEKTDGAFDITVGPLVNLWGFGPSDTAFIFPTDTEINIAKRSIGYQHLEVRIDPPAVNKKIADLYVDLSAIAKGYAVDEIAQILDDNHVRNYMVEIGGEVKGSGIAPHGNPWRIGIETPNFERGKIEKIISLQNVGVATSGDYRNFIKHEGKRYSHTIDPRNGYPVSHNLGSVTVIHQSTAIADAWATAFIVLGPKKSYQLASDNNLSGVLITREGINHTSTIFGKMQSYLAQ